MLISIISLVFLLFFSGFFSGAETGIMSLNRYRLRHLAKKGQRSAVCVNRLLQRPDRLIGAILLGNIFCNMLASSIATVLSAQHFGGTGVFVITSILSVLVLIFSEALPKTFAALYPLRVAFFSAYVLQAVLYVLYPIVFLINSIANGVLKIFGVRVRNRMASESLSMEELRTVLDDSSVTISSNYRSILLRVLDLETINIESVMVPYQDIEGVDLHTDWEVILEKLLHSPHHVLPVYKDSVDNIQGMLDIKQFFLAMQKDTFVNKESLLSLIEKPYYIPESVLIGQQLLNFQCSKQTIGLVVDEYGQLQGLVSLQDILEEIVGEFSFHSDIRDHVAKQKDGSYLVSGSVVIRDVNRFMSWKIPTEGPVTLSGLMVEKLETIPAQGILVDIPGYRLKAVKVSTRKVQKVQVFLK